MGRNSSGVKGISLVGDDRVVGMVVVDPDATLLTACQNGYGKRTPFGLNATPCGPNAAPFCLDGKATSSRENRSDHVAGVVHNLNGAAVRVVRKIDDPPASGGHAGRSRKGLGERIGG